MKSIEAAITADKVVKQTIPRRCHVVGAFKLPPDCRCVSAGTEGQKWENGSDRRGERWRLVASIFTFVPLLFMSSRRSGRESSFHLMMIVARDI